MIARAHVIHVLVRKAMHVGVLLLGGLVALGQTPVTQNTKEAEPATVNARQQNAAQDLKGLADPTVMQRRVWLETEWNKYRNETHSLEETLGALWAWRIAPSQDWGVRLKLPYEWRVARGTSENGPGDLKLATGTAFHLGKSWRAAAGLELRMPTAAEDLGGRDWRLQEYGAVACDIARWCTLSPYFEYNHSLAEVDNAPPQSYLDLYFPATFLLPHRWSVTARYEARVDFEHDSHLIQSAKLQVAKQLAGPPIGFALGLKKPFDGGLKQFQMNFIITYYIR